MEMLTYQCPNCGGELAFDPQTQQLSCAFCQSTFSSGEIDALYAQREQQAAADAAVQQAEDARSEHPEAETDFSQHTHTYICNSCGAEIVTDDTTAATFCYYCHDPVVLTDRLAGGSCPAKVVPFGFDREEAKKVFLGWAGKKWFLPRDFLDQRQIEKIAGVYYPFWLTDSDVEAGYTAVATNRRSWTSGDYRYTETTTYSILRRGNIHFEDIVSPALTKMDHNLVQGILPFPVASVQDFSMRCLSGFMAEKRDIDKEALKPQVEQRMAGYAQKLLEDTVRGYQSVAVRSSSCTPHRTHWDYTMMPVWILTYKDSKRGQRYTYAINGQTRAVYGRLPVDPVRLGLLFGGVAAAAFALITLIGGLIL